MPFVAFWFFFFFYPLAYDDVINSGYFEFFTTFLSSLFFDMRKVPDFRALGENVTLLSVMEFVGFAEFDKVLRSFVLQSLRRRESCLRYLKRSNRKVKKQAPYQASTRRHVPYMSILLCIK